MGEALRRPLSELVISLRRGQSYKSALVGKPGPILLGLGTINRNGGFRHGNLRSYGGQTPTDTLLHPGDLYVSLKDMTHAADLLGAVARVPDYIELGRLTQDTIRLDVGDGYVERDYLYWALRDPACRAHCKKNGTGTTNLDLSRSDFLSYPVRCPKRAEQRAIAEVLGALDDKIAANERLSTTCVALADAKFSAAVRGATLQEQTFGDLAAVSGGGTPRTKVEEFWGGEVPWATPTDVTALRGPYLSSTARMITAAGLESCSSPLYPVGSILMTSRATIGAFAVAQRPMAVNQGFIVVNARNPELQWWLFHEMRRRVSEFVSHANGATFLELSRGKFKQFRVHLAEESSMVEFGREADSLHRRAHAALQENERLAHTRDTLLPLLMSGKVRVKDAEKIAEEAL